MIDVQTAFPFKFCRICQRMETDTEQEKIYSWDQVVENRITIRCRREQTCRYLIEEIRRNGLKNMEAEARDETAKKRV